MVINMNDEHERGADNLQVVYERLRERLKASPDVRAAEVYACALCSDTGYEVLEVDGVRCATDCACKLSVIAERRMARAGVPEKYAKASFAQFNTQGMTAPIVAGAMFARQMVDEFPTLGGRGLLLHGSCGTGKTHLAVATLRNSMEKWGVTGKFWNVGKLLSEIRFTYGKDAHGDTERDLRRELQTVQVLVLDDLGAERSTDWASDQVVQVINDRYDAGRCTHITTNYPNLGAGEGGRVETLGDRIGARMWSRLQEMCRPMEMVGGDYRRRAKA